MTRHARNCTAGAVYTYHEKKKDAQASGYGTNTQRIGKDSVKDFDCCSLTLQPCRNPVITKDGYLFDKEAILEYICTKKLDYATKMKEYEKQISKEKDKMIYCPMSGKPLKVKDLIDVKFTLVNDPHDKRSLIAKENRYMCPITHDILGNAVPCAILKTSGDVVTMECVEKIIKKDWLHPLTGAKLTERDIITLQRGGTGYSTTNMNLEGKHERPVLQA
uniref:U-box domain-containing protein n=1 Tax=Timema douglasi TaxID=61478 RepID=A0A7R8VV80_TIMDO|nr:unnamed protein product [Timema douglasi]